MSLQQRLDLAVGLALLPDVLPLGATLITHPETGGRSQHDFQVQATFIP